MTSKYTTAEVFYVLPKSKLTLDNIMNGVHLYSAESNIKIGVEFLYINKA